MTENPSNSILTTLTQRHQTQIAQQRTPFTLRMHRALSWLQRAEAARAMTMWLLSVCGLPLTPPMRRTWGRGQAR